jgi:hypothetical protein
LRLFAKAVEALRPTASVYSLRFHLNTGLYAFHLFFVFRPALGAQPDSSTSGDVTV